MICSKKAAAAVMLCLAGCGGSGTGGNPPTEVSANPPLQGPAPGPTPAPAPAPDDAVSGGPGEPPAAEDPPSPVTLAGHLLTQALERGVPITKPDPGQSTSGAMAWWAHQHTRVVVAADGRQLHYFAAANTVLSGEPYRENTVFPVRVRLARIASQTIAASINVLALNDIHMPAFAAPIPELVELGKPVGEWVNGEWFARLVPRTVEGQPDLFRVCWEYRMPDLPQVAPLITEDRGIDVRELPAGPPIARVQCSQHRRSDAVDVGATIEEGGTTYSGSWADDPAVIAAGT